MNAIDVVKKYFLNQKSSADKSYSMLTNKSISPEEFGAINMMSPLQRVAANPNLPQVVQDIIKSKSQVSKTVPNWNIPLKASTMAGDLLVNTAKSVLFGNTQQNRDAILAYNMIKNSVKPSDAQRSALRQLGSQHLMNVVGMTEPLLKEAKKYKSAEEFVKAQGNPVYHETSPETLSMIDNNFNNLDMQNKFVSTDKNFALGQGGKGVILEIDPAKVKLAEAQNKVGTTLMKGVTGVNPEKIITNSVDANKSVISILIKPETKISPLLQKKLDSKWMVGEILEDGSRRYYNKNRYTELIDIWNKANKVKGK